MHAPRVNQPSACGAPPGFVRKRLRDLRCVIREDLCRAFPDRWWETWISTFLQPDASCQVIKRGTYKTLLKTRLGDTVCLVKKYRIPGLQRRLVGLFTSSRPAREFAAGLYIAAQGIATAVPLLLAERVHWGLVGEGMVVMPFLEGAQELRDYLFARDVPDRERREVVRAFGRLTGEIFSRGIFQYDYALNNFLLRREDSGLRLYFIDFEKVRTGMHASRRQKMDMLSRLNRAGRQIGTRERLLFVRSYYAADPTIAPDSRACARELCRQTIAALRADCKRRRITSIYTHARFRRIEQDRCTGLCRNAYRPEDIIGLLRSAPCAAGLSEQNVACEGSAVRVIAIRCGAEEAETLWALLNMLVVAGADFDLPAFFVRNDRYGCIGFDPEDFRQCRRFLTQPTAGAGFLHRAFPREIEKLRIALGAAGQAE